MALLTRHASASSAGRVAAAGRVLAWVALACVGWTDALAVAPERTISEKEVRAVFMLHLARFVRWPDEAFADADSPLVIGVYQSDELADILTQAVRGEKLGPRAIVCRSLDTPGDLDFCHLVFVGEAAVRPLAPLLARLRSRPILLVSDAEGFLNLGGHVQFLTRSGEVKIRIAPRNIKSAHLAASAQLLRVARVD